MEKKVVAGLDDLESRKAQQYYLPQAIFQSWW